MNTIPILFIATLAQAAPASPQDRERAQALLIQGSSMYEMGNYAGALDKFNSAYSAYPSPKIWFNIGQANRDLGRLVEALEAFGKYLAGAPDAGNVTSREARASIAELQTRLGRLRIDCDTVGAEVSIDGRSVGLTPLPEPVWATAGRHQLTASRASVSPVIENADVEAGTIHTVSIRLAPLSTFPPSVVAASTVVAPAPSRSDDGAWWLGRRWTWVAAGSAALLAIGAATTGLSMRSEYDDLNRSCGSASAGRPGCNEDDINSVGTRQTVANTLWGLTGAAAVAAGILFFVEGRPLSVAPMAGEVNGIAAGMRY